MSIKEKLTAIAANEYNVYNAGKEAGKAEKRRERFEYWQNLQEYGKRTHYGAIGEQTLGAFQGADWTDNNFNPLYYKISPVSCYNMFRGSAITSIIDKIKLDTSKSITLNAMFYDSKIQEVGDIDCTGVASNAQKLHCTFAFCKDLKTIGTIKMFQNITFTNTFMEARSLENIKFAECDDSNNIGIGQNGLDLQWSTKLSKDSIKSIANAISSEKADLHITLSAKAVNTAFETSEGLADGTTSEEWMELIQNKPGFIWLA